MDLLADGYGVLCPKEKICFGTVGNFDFFTKDISYNDVWKSFRAKLLLKLLKFTIY